MIVYNAEPFGYSIRAVKKWEEKGYEYLEGNWNEIDRRSIFSDVTILIVRLQRKIDEAVLKKFPQLEKLVSATTGHDHISLNDLEVRGIKLLSLRGHDKFLNSIPSTAEHTWALLMALVKCIPDANEHVKVGQWNRDLFRGYQLKDKVLGIIGYGRTGKKVAKYARAFDMHVRFFDPYVDKGADDEKVGTLQELIASADIISIHVHLNENTTSLLNAACLSSVKSHALIVNTSRGKVWDESIIAEYIRSGKIGGIATDVLATELHSISESPVWKAQKEGFNVIITPHIGGASWDAMWSCEEYLASL